MSGKNTANSVCLVEKLLLKNCENPVLLAAYNTRGGTFSHPK